MAKANGYILKICHSDSQKETALIKTYDNNSGNVYIDIQDFFGNKLNISKIDDLHTAIPNDWEYLERDSLGIRKNRPDFEKYSRLSLDTELLIEAYGKEKASQFQSVKKTFQVLDDVYFCCFKNDIIYLEVSLTEWIVNKTLDYSQSRYLLIYNKEAKLINKLKLEKRNYSSEREMTRLNITENGSIIYFDVADEELTIINSNLKDKNVISFHKIVPSGTEHIESLSYNGKCKLISCLFSNPHNGYDGLAIYKFNNNKIESLLSIKPECRMLNIKVSTNGDFFVTTEFVSIAYAESEIFIRVYNILGKMLTRFKTDINNFSNYIRDIYFLFDYYIAIIQYEKISIYNYINGKKIDQLYVKNMNYSISNKNLFYIFENKLTKYTPSELIK